MPTIFFLLLCLFGSGFSFAAERTRGLPELEKHIKPVNVEQAKVGVVSGSVTVRLYGALVIPQRVNYTFSPEFVASYGDLTTTEYGTYFMSASNVPLDQPYTLTISAIYTDPEPLYFGGQKKMRPATSGSVTIKVPYGHDFDFGVQFIDLR